MKKLIGSLTLVLTLSACNGGGGGSSDSPSAVQDTSPVATASPTPSPTPSVAPTATPSPTPTLAPAWGGFSGGGVLANPYQVTTATDVTHIGDFPAAYFELTGNIDMSGTTIVPISSFSGVIQGHLFALENLTIQTMGSTPSALVVALSGIINKLYMSNILVEASGNYAAAYGINVSGTISNCQILSGTINSHLGGNGNGVGTGNPIYTNAVGSPVVTGDQSTAVFNGNSFFATY